MTATHDKIAEIVCDLINMHREEEIDLADISPDTDLYSVLGLDSVMAVALIVQLQRQLRVKVPFEVIPTLRTIRDIHSHLAEVHYGDSEEKSIEQ